MKKIIVASFLSLMLLGVGSANAADNMSLHFFDEDGKLYMWKQTFINECVDASQNGVLVKLGESETYRVTFTLHNETLYKLATSFPERHANHISSIGCFKRTGRLY